MSGFTGAEPPQGRAPGPCSPRQGRACRQQTLQDQPLDRRFDRPPELDGALAAANALGQRLPFNTDPICRNKINTGEIDFIDMHLSHVAQHAWFGFLGPCTLR